MKTYRVAILGCRGRGTAAARAYHAHPRVKVVALCDLIQERLDTLGDELSIAARFTDLDEMILQTQPDIVAIPTGTEFHYELCMRVLEHGVHIEVEKPMCVDLEQADAVMAKAREKGVRVAVHHQGRVGAFMQAMYKAFSEGAIGELGYINSRGKAYYGGLGLMNIGTHQLNNMLKFAGHCRSVSAVALTDNHPITPDDVVPSPLGMGTIAGEHITATLHFDNGVTANLLQHRSPTGTNPVMEIGGTEGRLLGSACLLIKGGAWRLSQPRYIPNGKSDQWEPLEPIYPEHYDRSSPAALDDYWFADAYVRALDEDRDHECSGAEGHHIVEIMMGIFESAAYGKRVDLPQENREHPLLRWRREHDLAAPEVMPRPYNEWLEAEDRRLGRL
ncbi:MAG: Gfo/Idh/MocA family oxidoreductase [Candidatus Poribacteria bacterium]|nr:Gfo/Idh/MocA family oxidoreductase [Candidatus Poribacteria bacterium]